MPDKIGITLVIFGLSFLSCHAQDGAPPANQQATSDAPARSHLAKLLPSAAARPVDFSQDVQPIFRNHCFECHAKGNEEGGLNLSIKARAMEGGERGAVLMPGDSVGSPLMHVVSGIDEERRMPPEGNPRLNAEQVGILRAWIDQGAVWPLSADVVDPRLENARQHWAFQRLSYAQQPTRSPEDDWSETALDLFIRKKLSEHRLATSPRLDPRGLARRIYFDLTGLPPTPEQTQEFVAQYTQNPALATPQLIDRLLASPHYGERWGRHWLDLVRYADSDGMECDRDRPYAYRYRDFVVDAFNEDMPFDQFVRWQIAGDEYEPQNPRAVVATGFLTAGPHSELKEPFLEEALMFNRYNELDDIVSTLGTSLLGLTIGCARCHDHKFDAISSREYYRLMSAFHSGQRHEGELPNGQKGLVYKDFDAEPRTSWLFRRGDFNDRELEVKLGFLAILTAGRDAQQYWQAAKSASETENSTLQRRALADWITDVEQGGGALLARVIVNRIWQHHFGQGLVESESDFGIRSEPPSHPDLLEFLAADLVANGWNLKRMHRLILNSAVWQQTSREVSDPGMSPTDEVRRQLDPDNRWLWRMSPQRLEAEAIRDAMLSISGTLNFEAFGPGFKPYIPPEANSARNIQGDDYPEDALDDTTTRRRSVYMFHKRLVPYPLFQAFDRPDFLVSCSRRDTTTVAPQALALLNDGFVRTCARNFARRLLAVHGEDDPALVAESIELALARPPTKTETRVAIELIRSQSHARQLRQESEYRREAVTDYCQALFGLNEFIFVD